MRVGIVSLFVIAGMIPVSAIPADDFQTYQKKQQQEMSRSSLEFQEYKKQQDQEFADFLKSRWSEFETFRGKVRIKEPKPKVAPVAVPVVTPKPESSPKPQPTAPVKPEITPIVHAPVIQPVIPPPPPPQPKPVAVAPDILKIGFFGNSVEFAYDPKWKKYRLNGGAKPEAMSAFWSMMSSSNYMPTIKAIDATRKELKLDDWGVATFCRSIAQALQPDRSSEQNLLLWYFLVKSGYDVRLGYSGQEVYLFIAMKQPVYSTQYTKVGSQTYYAALAADHGKSIKSFFTYEANYPERLRPLDVHAASVGFIKTVPAQRALVFDYYGKPFKFNVTYDRRLIEYLETFPQSEIELYFDTDGSSLVRKGLLTELKKYISSMNEEEAVDFLLAFVQKSFAYKTDQAQFGYEKYFFVEDSMYFPYSDCEDRAVLFGWLTRELLGIKVVGLLYPGHMTTAVALKKVKKGASTIEYQGRHWVIADPTYIGASAGMAMPSYEKLKPKRVVEIQ